MREIKVALCNVYLLVDQMKVCLYKNLLSLQYFYKFQVMSLNVLNQLSLSSIKSKPVRMTMKTVVIIRMNCNKLFNAFLVIFEIKKNIYIHCQKGLQEQQDMVQQLEIHMEFHVHLFSNNYIINNYIIQLSTRNTFKYTHMDY